ncbi:MAG: VOC family protein [Sphingomonadales bacterium]|nr:MAG: VOC family protein [Sphingomonadales bacterium]
MFKNLPSSAIVAVSDLDRARAFYAETLGLESTGDDEELLSFRTGSTRLIVYRSDGAGTNQANAVVWGAGQDFDAVIGELRSNGVTLEEYPDMGMQVAAGIHSTGEFKAAWFKDPDGNILHVNNM